LLSCLVFLALPILLVRVGLERVWDHQERAVLEQAWIRLDNVLLEILRREDTAVYVADLLDRAFQRSAEAGGDRRVPVLAHALRSLHRRFPGLLQVNVTDGQGRRLAALSNVNPPREILRRLYLSLRGTEEGSPDEMERNWEIIRTWIGPVIEKGSLARKHRSLHAASHDETRSWFFGAADPGLGLFVHVDRPASWSQLALRDKVDQVRRWPRRTCDLGILDLGTEGLASLDPTAARAIGEFERTTRNHLDLGDRIFSVMDSGSLRIWASRPRVEVVDSAGRRRVADVGALGLFLAFAVALWAVMAGHMGGTLPIRWRLVLLFGFSGGLPLLVILFAGWDYLFVLERNLVRSAFDETERRLRAFDAGFIKTREAIGNRMRRLLNERPFDPAADVAQVNRVLKVVARRFQPELTLYDEKGRPLLDWEPSEGRTRSRLDGYGKEVDRQKHFLGKVMKSLIARANREDTDTAVTGTMAMVESVGGLENLIGRLHAGFNRIVRLSAGGGSSWTALMPLKDGAGRVAHLLLLNWKQHTLERLYIEANRSRPEREDLRLRLLAADFDKGQFTPRDFPFQRRLRPFLQNLQIRQGSLFQELPVGSRRYLVIGLKPREFGIHYLVGLRRTDDIAETVATVRNRLLLFAAVVAALSLYLGVLLSRRFLHPIRELTRGVEAVRRQEFSFRLPAFDPDELGRFAATFNEMVAGLEEVALARLVQESLFPRGPVAVEGAEVFGACVPASQLGGDYLDYHALPDGRLLFLLGDVAGHGVSAALVMAMAKAVMAHPALADRPSAILEVLNRVLTRTLKRRKFMTCLLGLYQPVGRQLSLANAGQPYLYLLRGGALRALEFTGYPLGMSDRSGFKDHDLSLLPGDVLVFFTDGLPEAFVGPSRQIGHLEVERHLPGLVRDGAQATEAAIRAWHRTVVMPGPQEDDISILVLTIT